MKLLKFKENLKLSMKTNNVTQVQLAKYLNTTQQTVSRWLNGQNEPDMETLILICIYLGETPNSLLGFDETSLSKINNYTNYGIHTGDVKF